MYAGVGIWNDTLKQWVWKWDCGTESYTEKQKGEASDSFKRACFNLGIGRELYTSPRIFVGCETVAANGKYKLADPKKLYNISISGLEYKEADGKRSIEKMAISDAKGNKIWPLWRDK